MRVHANTPNLPAPNAPRPTGAEVPVAETFMPEHTPTEAYEGVSIIEAIPGVIICLIVTAAFISTFIDHNKADIKLVTPTAAKMKSAQRLIRPAVKQLNAGQLLGVAAVIAPAQEQYRRQHGHYTADLNALRALDRTLPTTPGITLMHLTGATARDDGWTMQQGNRQLVHFSRQPVGSFLTSTVPRTGKR